MNEQNRPLVEVSPLTDLNPVGGVPSYVFSDDSPGPHDDRRHILIPRVRPGYQRSVEVAEDFSNEQQDRKYIVTIHDTPAKQ